MTPGPAPSHQRRRRNVPAGGEWVVLPPLQEPVLPALPPRSDGTGDWPARTRRMWEGLRTDPVTQVYGQAEIALALEVIHLHEELVRGRTALAREIRMRLDGLGLTPKGKRDLRYLEAVR